MAKKIKLPDNLDHDAFYLRVSTEYKNALDFRRPATANWQANEDLLYAKKPKSLSKRSNIMIQLAHGFEDTLLAKVKNPPIVNFLPTEKADEQKARKVSALWQIESSAVNADWEYKDVLTKKLGITTGRAIFKIYSTAEPYRHYLEPIDTYDFLIDPMAGGMDIERANYCGQDNIFKTKYDLENNDSYDQAQVKELIAALPDPSASSNQTNQSIDNEYNEKRNRFATLGFDIERYNTQYEGIYKLVEWYTYIDGEKWYVLFSMDRKKIIKSMKLSEIITSYKEGMQPLYPFETWAYYPDIFNFWSPAPLDTVRELFILRNIVINQIIDNNEAKNKPMKSYDPNIYNKPGLLEYSPDRLIPVKSGGDPEKGLFIHTTPDLYNPKEMSDILEDLTGKITGVTAAASGAADDQNGKVGIYYGNQQEIAGRMSLFELSYTRCFIRLGCKYVNGLKEHLNERRAIKMIGSDGVEWDEISSDDLSEFDITFTGGVTQAKNDAIKAKAKIDFMNGLMQNGNAAQLINLKFAIENGATAAGLSADDAKRLVTKDNGNGKMISYAQRDIEKLLLIEKPNTPLRADTDYLNEILEFQYDNQLTPEQDAAFTEYIDSALPTVVQNMVLRARKELALKGQLPVPGQPPVPGTPAAELQQLGDQAPAPGSGPALTPAGADGAQASETSNIIKEGYPQ